MQKRESRRVLLFLSGGVSAESSVSLLSAQNVYPHLDRKHFAVLPVFIGPNGRWHLLNEEQAGDWPRLAHCDFSHESGEVALLPRERGLVLRTKAGERGIDLIFPMLHGPGGEDGSIQGLAEFFGVPVLGSDMGGSLINMDKVLMKALLEQKQIPCARYRSFHSAELGPEGPICNGAAMRQSYAALAAELFELWQCPALYVKPARMGSSLGISQVREAAELAAAIVLARRYDDTLLIEEGFCAVELELAALELNSTSQEQVQQGSKNHSSEPNVCTGQLHQKGVQQRIVHQSCFAGAASPHRKQTLGTSLQISNAATIHSNGEFYSYEQKYFPETQEHTLLVEPHNNLPPQVVARARSLAAQAFRALGARHYGRIDLFYLVDEDRLLLNEINTIPGFTAQSMFPCLMEAEGWPMERLIPHLLQLALP